MLSKKIIIAWAMVSITGCTLAPVYQQPTLPIANNWPTGAAYTNNIDLNSSPYTAADIGWRTFFADPALQQLIDIALNNNRDLRVMTFNIAKARATYHIQRADLFPSIMANGTGTLQRVPNNANGQPTISRQYTAGVGFSSYELDLFGRVRSMKDQALALYYATEEAQRSAHIALVAEVANAYLTLLADNESLTLAKETYTSQQSSYQLTKRSFDAGIISELALNRALIIVETARADEALYQSRVAQDLNALTVLLGTAVPDNLSPYPYLHQTNILADLPAGLPSDLLQRRPDIMAAEHQLKAANANIGAARAAFFPLINLTANVGATSTALNQLFKAGSGTWTFIPQITLPIFMAGQNMANLDIAHITKNIHIAQYEKTIQQAFREVADTLAQRSSLIDQLRAQQSLTDITNKTYQLAELRYRQGIDSHLSLLDAQRTLYAAQQELINTKRLQLSNLVNFYKAVGGGWVEQSTQPISPQVAAVTPVSSVGNP